MRRLSSNIFDQSFQGGATLYTASQHASMLGLTDRLVFHVVTDRASYDFAGFPPKLTAAIQHSADGVNWLQKNASNEIDDVNLSVTGTTNLVAVDSAPGTPNLRFVRLRVSLTGTGGAAHVRIYATSRDRAKAENPISEVLQSCLDGFSSEVLIELAEVLEHIPKLSPAAWEEIAELATESKRVEINDRFDYVFRRTSAETTRELDPVGRALARLAPLVAQGLLNRLARKTRRDLAELLDADVGQIMEVPSWEAFRQPPADRPGMDTRSASWLDVKPEPEVFANWTTKAGRCSPRRHARPCEVHRLLRRLTRRHAARLAYVAVQMLSPREIVAGAPAYIAPQSRPEANSDCDCAGQCGPCSDGGSSKQKATRGDALRATEVDAMA